MAFSASYLVDLSAIKFEDPNVSTETWIQAMPLGKYDHPTYGEIDITPDTVKAYADSVQTGVRSQQLDIDYDHKAYNGEAAGWVKDAQARQDGLWLLVDWTKKAYQLIKDKAYRYFSPEFDDEWTHPKTNVKHTNVIFGGAITNRPFLKDIMPLNLSEVFANVPPSPNKLDEGGSSMKPEQIKDFGVKLGLGDSATEEQVLTALGSFDFSKPTPPPATPPADQAAALKAIEDAKKLSETSPAVKAVMDLFMEQSKLVKDQGEKLAELATRNHKVEVEDTVKALSDKANSKGYAIPPALQESLTTTLLSVPDPEMRKTILAGYETVVNSQVVALGERGYLRNTRDAEGRTATDEYKDEVKKLTEGKDGMTFADAAEKVAILNPDLANRYRTENYAFSDGGGN